MVPTEGVPTNEALIAYSSLQVYLFFSGISGDDKQEENKKYWSKQDGKNDQRKGEIKLRKNPLRTSSNYPKKRVSFSKPGCSQY